jgi:hypothetical protein
VKEPEHRHEVEGSADYLEILYFWSSIVKLTKGADADASF